MARLNDKTIRFKQWFAERYGNDFSELGEDTFRNWTPPETIADTHRRYMRDLPDHSVSFNFAQKWYEKIRDEVRMTGKFDAHYKTAELINEAIEKFDPSTVVDKDHGAAADTGTGSSEPAEPIKVEAQCIDDMEFPEFKLHHTGTVVDKLDSDFTEEGGQYGGVVAICTGESGVGKSTVLIDKLAKYKRVNPDIKVCYFSTEMTRNDLFFYRQKNPLIGKVPTVLSTDYMEGGALKQAVYQVFEGDWDIILLDSYQDLLGTMKDLCDITEGAAQRMIIGLMIEAAEKRGTTILAIQHLTKGGQYVGSTFLKHKTTAMMHFKFDEMGNRYVEYSKNRRGGSMQDKPLYYSLDENGEVVYDEKRFNELLNTENKSHDEADRAKQHADNFQKIMEENAQKMREREETFAKHEDDDINGTELHEMVNQPSTPSSDNEDDGAEIMAARNAVSRSRNVAEAINELAEEIEFEDIPSA